MNLSPLLSEILHKVQVHILLTAKPCLPSSVLLMLHALLKILPSAVRYPLAMKCPL
ncbi:hypothetical protein DPMN_080358 [Dreissena polymorpha]|uniref:Uncharacterized protein n=1 Tax=Dreissena polymorpha TaxID=45954 RepID=A0A9D3YUW4_DREPO|nr:hypothetical protein DPMN_080358 [Dreissena polymorpha]